VDSAVKRRGNKRSAGAEMPSGAGQALEEDFARLRRTVEAASLPVLDAPGDEEGEAARAATGAGAMEVVEDEQQVRRRY
jgi:hypothetical protein